MVAAWRTRVLVSPTGNAAAALAWLAVLTAGIALTAGAAETVAVRVGNLSISREAIDAVLGRVDAAAAGGQKRQLEAAVVEQMVDELLLRMELERQLIAAADSEIDARVERLKSQFAGRGMTFDEFLARSGRDERSVRAQVALEIGLDKYVRSRMTPQVIAAAYETHRREVDGTRLRVSHVLLRPVVAADDGDEARLRQADAIRREVLQGRTTFEEAARRHSAGPSRHRGGDLGWIGRDGPFVEAFAKPAFALAKGEVSKPFVTPFGIHIVKVTEVEPGRIDAEAAKPRLEQMVAAQLIKDLVATARRTTHIDYGAGVAHFDPATPGDGPQPRRVLVGEGEPTGG